MSHRAKVWTALGTIYVLWGSTYLGIELTGETIPPLLAAAVPWATGAFLSGRLPLPADSLAATAVEMLTGGLVLLPLALAAHPHVGHISARSIAGFVYLVTFGSLIGYTAFVWLLDNAPIQRVATYAYVNPIVAIGLGALVLHETISWRIGLGA